MKKLSLVGAFVKKATSRNEQTFPPARVRVLRLESLESRELLSVAPGSDLLVAETASICGDLTAEDVLDISGAALDGAKVQSGAAVSSASLIVVTSDVDVVDANDGVVTLREALANAESGATIAFVDSLKGKTIELAPNYGELSTGKTLTIDATNLWNAAEQTPGFTISGGGTSRILYLEEGAEVEIKGIAFADAHSDAGAIFNNKATLSLDNCAIRDNKASGVFSYDGKTTLIDCVIKNNIADASNGAAIYGKGATLSLSNCLICDNEAARGGGIYSENGKTTLANCTVANNTASLGGGVYLTGTAVLTAYNAIILNSGGSDVFRNGSNVKAYAYNTLSNYAAWTEGENNLTYDFWKPLFTNAEEGDYTLAKNSYALNKGNDEYVTTSDDLAGNARIVGRAVDLGAYEYQKSVNQETPSTVVTTTNDVFNEYDGAISLREAFEYAESGATITFADSLKGKTLGIDPNNGELSTDKTLTIDATNLWNSTEQTPGITISGDGTSRILYLEEGADVEIKGITFADAHSDAGAIYNDRATLSLDSCAIRDNEAGGVYSSAGKTTLTNCTISNNSGVGASSFAGETTLVNCVARNNIVGNSNGAGIYSNGAILSLSNCVISDNEARRGGGVYSENGKTTLTNCTVTNNSASLGGGVFLTGTAVLNAYNAIILSNGNSEVFRNGSNAKAYAYNTLSNYTAWTEGENNLTYDASKPLFTNAEEGDYTLAKNSYALNKGNDEYVTTSVDLAGNPRITGETVDLGAYEYQLEKLVAPANPREIAKTETTISVAWDAVSNASGYRLLWKNQADPEYAVVTLDATKTSNTFTGLDSSAIYEWKVKTLGDLVIYDDSDYTATRTVVMTVPPDEESPIVASVETSAVASGDELNELRIVFSEPVQLQTLIDNGSIASVFQLAGGNKGVPISLGADAFKYDATTATLVVSLAGLDDATIKDFAISVKDGLAATKLTLLVDSSRVLDLAGNALRGSAVSTGADALDLVLLSEIVAETDASSAPALYDWNGDGALDLVVGEKSADGLGRVKVYLNQGATDALAYTDSFYASYWDASASCSVEIAVSGEIAPRIADITEDGLDDLLVGLPDGTIALYRGAQFDGERVFSAPETVLVGASGKKKTLDVGSEAVVEVFDWNGDGRNDLVVGAADGKVRVYVDASKVAGKYDFQTAATLAVGTKDLVVESGYSAPTVADVDGDDVFDLVSGNASGAMLVYRNAGTNASPKFEAATPLLDANDEPVTLGDATNSRPFAYDVNGDGVPDYLVGGSDGSVGYYEGVRLVPPNSDGTPGVPFSCSISFPFALSDPNAPVYATPTISRFGVADSGDLVVLWSTADPAEKYAVEYRLRGAENWTGVGYFTPQFAALPGANYGVGNVVQARVKAVASDAKGESAWSKVVQYEIVGERSSYTVATDVHEVGDVYAVSVVVESDVDAIGRWTIDWNDGSEPTTFVGLSMSRTLSHIYATSGVFAPILYLDDREGVALDSITVQLSSAATLDAAPCPLFIEPTTSNARFDAVFSQFTAAPVVGPIMPDRALLSRREPTATARKATRALDRAFADMTLDSDALEFELEDDFFGDEILANFFKETL